MGTTKPFLPNAAKLGPKGASVNISVYMFNDVNQNEEYGLGDRPLAGIAVLDDLVVE